MSVVDSQLKDLRHAYRVIGVPLEASAHSIKKAYRRLIKRWHPDLYAADTEATEMTTLINEAYSSIAHAPLRYHSETDPRQESTRNTSPETRSAEPIGPEGERPVNTDRIEFWVRFTCGAAAGVLVCLDLLISAAPDSFSSLWLLAFGVVVLGCGYGAARYGDKFWHSIFRRWWLWS